MKTLVFFLIPVLLLDAFMEATEIHAVAEESNNSTELPSPEIMDIFIENGTIISTTEIDLQMSTLITNNHTYDANRNCSKNSDCEENEFCKTLYNLKSGFFDFVCSCNPDSFIAPNGICKRKSKYGESCSEIQPCQDNNPLLSCNSTTSQCDCLDNSTQIFDTVKGFCAIKVGEDCRNYRRHYNSICSINAYCKAYSPTKPKFLRCTCMDGYKNIDGNCVASFGQVCNKTSICNSKAGLVCGNGKCMCNSPLSEIYDPFHEECRKIIGSSCDSNQNGNDSRKCIKSAICIQGKCECKVGYLPTLHYPKICKLSFLSQCKDSGKYSNQCNNERGLICKNELCQCLDPDLIYDDEKESCLNQDGSICGAININQNENDGKKSFQSQALKNYNNNTMVIIGCTSNSICSKIQGDKTCSCLQVRIIESDKIGKVEYCSPAATKS